jgi:hypothetical protein
MLDAVVLFERAASDAAAMAGRAGTDQRHAATPCTERDVDALLAHMVAGTGYLLGALGVDARPVGTDEASFRRSVSQCVEALRAPGAIDCRCMSPAGFE